MRTIDPGTIAERFGADVRTLPAWANWLALDVDGAVCMFEQRPVPSPVLQCYKLADRNGRCERIATAPPPDDWTQALFQINSFNRGALLGLEKVA